MRYSAFWAITAKKIRFVRLKSPGNNGAISTPDSHNVKMRDNACAFTGHRPSKLPWGNDEASPQFLAFRATMETQITALSEAGAVTIICLFHLKYLGAACIIW